MAKLHGINTKISGQVGDYMFKQTKYGTVVYEAPVQPDIPRRSEKQMNRRTQLSNLGANYKHFDGTLKRGHESIPSNMSDYNAFVQSNLGKVIVYLPKQDAKNGGCVLAPYQLTSGTLPSITMQVNASGILVSGLSLGSLVIDSTTTVGEFSEALLANNTKWNEGDQLTFYHGIQYVDTVSNTPRATIDPYKVVLDTYDDTPLWNVTGSLGYSTVDGHLGMSQALTSGAAVWVHSRETSSGTLKVSTQFFYVNNPVLADYQTSSAFNASADSYGGINTEAVYLQPDVNSLNPGASLNQNGSNGNAVSGGDDNGSSNTGGSNTGGTGDSGGGDDNGGGNDNEND